MEKIRLIDEQYKIVYPIKRGGFGIVYFGWDLFLDKPIAIKEILPDLLGDTQTIDMFRDEAVNTARLNHPNIVQIYNLRKTSDGRFFIVMEYIDGIDLKRMTEKCIEYKKPIPFHVVSYIISEICKALEYAHTKKDVKTNELLNIIHRDVSPSNIMITSDGIVKLIDFGIAKARFRRSETQQGLIKGKISYISPEQILGNEVDRRSDLFSLGIVFYELLTLTKPFQGNSDYNTLHAIVKCEYDLKKLTENDTPDQLIEVVKKCLQKDKDKRYRSANEIYYDVNKFLITKSREELDKELKDFIYELFYDDIKKQYTIYSKAVEEEVVETISTNDITHQTPTPVIQPEVLESKTIEAMEPRKEPQAERTIADIVKLAERGKKRHVVAGAIGIVLLCILFLVFDYFFHWTSIGMEIYSRLNPPVIQIHSIPPGANVFIDGKPINKVTPAHFNELASGDHLLELRLAGYPSIVRSIHIAPPGQQKKKRSPEKFLFSFETKVKIESDPPNAEIWLSDTKKFPKKTPCEFNCTIGDTLSLRLIKEGFLPAEKFVFYTLNRKINNYDRQTWSAEDIKSDGVYELKVHAIFSKLVKMHSTPPRAYVYVDDDSLPLGKTNLEASLRVGEHKLRIKKYGFLPVERVVSVNVLTDEIYFELFRSVKISVSSQVGTGRDIGAKIRYIRPYRSKSSIYRRLTTPTVVNLKTQRYILLLSKPGFIDTLLYFTPRANDFRIKMRPQNPFVEFIVFDNATGKPIPNCIIRYRPIKTGSRELILKVLGKTDNSGRYRDRMVPGRYNIQFDKSGHEIKAIIADVKYNSDNKKIVKLERFK